MSTVPRYRNSIVQLFLLATFMMMALPVVHASHTAAALAGTMEAEAPSSSAHTPHEADSQDHAHCEQSATHGHQDHSDHGDHGLLHELMECDCLLCKLAQAPPLSPVVELPLINASLTQAQPLPPKAPATLATTTRPPSRAPPSLI